MSDKGVLGGFKEFVMRGNVIDLAVAVVVGGAFGALVASFTGEIIEPVIAAFGGTDTQGVGFCVDGADPCTVETATFVDFGAVLGVLISFVITMAVVYFVFVLPMNKARARSAPKEAEPAATPEDIALLTEIRDLLSEQAGRPAADSSEDSGS